mmetsp:Transcript_17891/g.35867  ORF Transcript_17891/g.35867 Transcript_17891/m.35867 type:complete len:256 (-) Transcript_17891:621-1388(-)
MLGKEEKGKAMAADMARADPKLNSCTAPQDLPTCAIMGTTTIAATLWLTNVAMTQAATNTSAATRTLLSGRACLRAWTMWSRSWLLSTTLPRTLLPPRRKRVCHAKLFRSISVSIPHPNTTPMNRRLTTPRSPNSSLLYPLSAQATIVPKLRQQTKRLTPSPTGDVGLERIFGIFSTSSGRRRMIIRHHTRTVPVTAMGRASHIHSPKLIGCPCMFICCTAMIFCRLAMGVSIPPKLQAKATPRRRALTKRVSAP